MPNRDGTGPNGGGQGTGRGKGGCSSAGFVHCEGGMRGRGLRRGSRRKGCDSPNNEN